MQASSPEETHLPLNAAHHRLLKAHPGLAGAQERFYSGKIPQQTQPGKGRVLDVPLGPGESSWGEPGRPRSPLLGAAGCPWPSSGGRSRDQAWLCARRSRRKEKAARGQVPRAGGVHVRLSVCARGKRMLSTMQPPCSVRNAPFGGAARRGVRNTPSPFNPGSGAAPAAGSPRSERKRFPAAPCCRDGAPAPGLGEQRPEDAAALLCSQQMRNNPPNGTSLTVPFPWAMKTSHSFPKATLISSVRDPRTSLQPPGSARSGGGSRCTSLEGDANPTSSDVSRRGTKGVPETALNPKGHQYGALGGVWGSHPLLLS